MTRRQAGLLTAAMLIGVLVAALDQTIVDTAFPRMVSELGGASKFTWVITAYLLASVSFVPLIGKLADIYGRKLFWNLGVSLFVIASALCGSVTNMDQLIIYRGLQGIGAGAIMPLVMTVLGDIYTGPARAKMQGMFGGAAVLGSIIGPLAGGLIVDHMSWRYIFLLNLPTGAICLLLAAFAFPPAQKAAGRKVDLLGAVLSVVGISAVLLGFQTGGNEWPWSSWQVLSLLIGGLAVIVLFTIVELRVPEPILDMRLFRNRIFSSFFVETLIVTMGMYGAIVFVPWFIQGVVGVSATSSGAVMLPMTIMAVIGSVLSGQIVKYLRYMQQVLLGIIILMGGIFVATTFTVHTSLWTARAAIMLIGFGVGLIVPLTVLALQEEFGAELRAVVTAANAFAKSLGATIGVTLFGVLFNARMSHEYAAQMQPKFANLPAALTAQLQVLAAKPVNLVQILLQPKLQQALPAGVRPVLLETIKDMTTAAIHPIFWVALGIAAAGGVVAFFLGGARMAPTTQTAGGISPAETFAE